MTSKPSYALLYIAIQSIKNYLTMSTKTPDLAYLQPDPHNANKGTRRSRGLLEHSLRQYGASRSILADRNCVVTAGILKNFIRRDTF